MKEIDTPIKLPRWEELPKIDLYIDQVVNLLDEWLDFITECRTGKIHDFK